MAMMPQRSLENKEQFFDETGSLFFLGSWTRVKIHRKRRGWRGNTTRFFATATECKVKEVKFLIRSGTLDQREN